MLTGEEREGRGNGGEDTYMEAEKQSGEGNSLSGAPEGDAPGGTDEARRGPREQVSETVRILPGFWRLRGALGSWPCLPPTFKWGL